MSSSQTLPENDFSITALAQQVFSLSSKISSYLTSNSCPQPSLSINTGPVPETPEYDALRSNLNDAAVDLLLLINGPRNTLRNFAFSHYDLAALQVALDRGFFSHVPLPATSADGDTVSTASIGDIAKKAGMDEDRTGRVMKLLATHRIFEEVGSGSFRHTANSIFLAQDREFHAMADMQMDDMLKAVSETSTVVASGTAQSAFQHRFGLTMYQYYEQNPAKGTRFAQAMSSWSQADRQVTELVDSFRWASLGDGTVVDIGGGSGHISIALARHFPALNFVVQDISQQMLSHSQQDLSGRIAFQKHDFFTPQPVRDAAAFLLRQCLHNYNDSDSIKILRAVVPALEQCEPGTPLLINDVVLPDSGTVTRYEENHLRQVDFCMLALLGAKQRSQRDFESLLKKADERFEIVDVHKNALGVGLLEVHLNVA